MRANSKRAAWRLRMEATGRALSAVDSSSPFGMVGSVGVCIVRDGQRHVLAEHVSSVAIRFNGGEVPMPKAAITRGDIPRHLVVSMPFTAGPGFAEALERMAADAPEDPPVCVVVQDSAKGYTERACGQTVYDWTEGNWSCDCNRADLFGHGHLDEDGRGACRGGSRYYVVAVDPMPAGYTLEDFNAEYPSRRA